MRLKFGVFILLISLFCSSSWALDLSSYELTDVQYKLLHAWNAEGKFDSKKLYEIAGSFDRFNKQPKPYIPPYTAKSLQAVTDWAEGSSFAMFARFTIYEFDQQRYEEDCPDRALFNFGYATGVEFLRRDVLEKTFFSFNALAMYLQTSPATFSEAYLELARARGFDRYLSEKPQNIAMAD